jgi:hypothetical protein
MSNELRNFAQGQGKRWVLLGSNRSWVTARAPLFQSGKSLIAVVRWEMERTNSTKKLKAGLVDVSQIAELFGISESTFQRLVIYDGMPRVSRGECDLLACSKWYLKYLHAMACGCAGPCDGVEAETRAETNVRAERKTVLKEIADDLAPELAGKKSDAIRPILVRAIDDAYTN